MFALGPRELDDAARSVAKRWGWYLLAGVAITVIGLLLLFNLFDAVATLAILVGVSLVIQGVDEIANAGRYQPRWPGYVLGLIDIVAGGLALAWPGVTLWALAVIVGVGYLVSGIAQLVFVIRNHHDLPNRWVFVLLGAVSVLTGLVALSWPRATILVLAIFLGIRVLMTGIAMIAFSLGLREINQLPA